MNLKIPANANPFNGKSFVIPPVNINPRPPIATLAKASIICKNHAALNWLPSPDL